MVVVSGQWEFFRDFDYTGDSRSLNPGYYPYNDDFLPPGQDSISSLRPVDTAVIPKHCPSPKITFYNGENFQGRHNTVNGDADLTDFVNSDLENKISSIRVECGRWIVYQDIWNGRHAILEEGDYPNAASWGENGPVDNSISTVRQLTLLDGTGPAITLFEHPNLEGRTLVLGHSDTDIHRSGFGDITSSLIVTKGTWLLAEGRNYDDIQKTFSVGVYPAWSNLDILNDRTSSVKLINEFDSNGCNEITLYSNDNYGGISETYHVGGKSDFIGKLNDKTSSIKVKCGTWLLYEHDFSGVYLILGPGDYPTSSDFDTFLEDKISSLRPLPKDGIMLFADPSYAGYSMALATDEHELRTHHSIVTDVLSSVIVVDGVWELYEDADYQGRKVKLTPGYYPAIDDLLPVRDNTVSSVKRIQQSVGDVGCHGNDIILYEHENFQGRSVRFNGDFDLDSMNHRALDNKVKSLQINCGTWILYQDNFDGMSKLLGPGKYAKPEDWSVILSTLLSSLRAIPDEGIVLFETEGYRHRIFKSNEDQADINALGFGDITSSVIVRTGQWKLYEHWYNRDPHGRTVVLNPGLYPDYEALNPMGNNVLTSFEELKETVTGDCLEPEITFYNDVDFKGESFTTNGAVQVGTFAQLRQENAISSIKVKCGTWIVYQDISNGNHAILKPGDYPNPQSWGSGAPVDNSISTARPITMQGNEPTIALFECERFECRVLVLDATNKNIHDDIFGDITSSVIVTGGSWKLYADFMSGDTKILTEGEYPRHADLGGLGDRVSSVELL